MIQNFLQCTQNSEEVIEPFEFMNKFLEHCIESGHIEAISKSSINFLLLYIQHDQIPDAHISIAICHLLLACHLKPLSRPLSSCFFAVASNSNDQIDSSLTLTQTEFILDLLDSVMKNVPNGLKYENWVSERIAHEFCSVIERDAEIRINTNRNCLPIFRELLQTDNNNILELVVSSIGRLCDNKEIQDQLIRFLFSQDKQERTIINMLEHLLKFKQAQILMQEIINTIAKILKLCNGQEIIERSTRYEIYALKFHSLNRSSVQKAIIMMRLFQDNFVLSLVQSFEVMNSSSTTITKVILQLGPEEMKQLSGVVDVIKFHIKKKVKLASRATQIFQVLIDHIELPDELKLFPKVINALQACIKNEKIFSTLLNFVIGFDNMKMQLIFKKSVTIKTVLVATLLEAFEHFKHPMALRQVMMTFTKIAINSPSDLKEPLKALFDLFYDEFLQAETNLSMEGSETKSPKLSLIKMNIMIESQIISFLDLFQLDAITIINTTHLMDPQEPMIPFFARFHTTVLKAMWNILVLKKVKGESGKCDFPYDLQFVANAVSDLAGKLMTLMKCRQMNLLEAHDVFTSLTELLHHFRIRPLLLESDTRCLTVNPPKVTARQMTELCAFAEHYIFNVDVSKGLGKGLEKFNDVSFQRNMLLRLAQLIKNNKTLVNITCLSTILRFYRDGSNFEDEMELLMKCLFERPLMFNRTIGLVIFHFSKQEASFKEFLRFTSSLNRFLDFYNTDKHVVTWKICSFVLRNLSPFIEIMTKNGADYCENRLGILDFVQVVAGEIDIKGLKTL